MKPRTHKRLLKAWPALCGLATFGIFAAVSFAMPSGSLVMPAFAGGLAWVASYAMLHAESGDVAVGTVNEDPFDDLYYPTTDWLNGVSRNSDD
ncbi:MAG TPA: hypothetical protein PLR02_02930 [Rhodocyclaceae bacterium]|nr:hypothetical protein [Rhodocyclaceae bacterium]